MILVDSAGQRATIMTVDLDHEDVLEVRLDNGRLIQLPKSALTRQENGAWTARLRFDQLGRTEEPVVLPVIAETMTVTRREVEAGRVRITKTVHEEEAVIDEPLLHDEVEVERCEVNQYVDTAPQTRTEGDTLIVPLVEEVLVVEKRLLLREELRITRRQTQERHADTVTLRREEAHVERFDSNQAGIEPEEAGT